MFCYFAEHFLFLLQLASTMREWDIPYEDLAIGDPIGKGRFGTVHKWAYGFFILSFSFFSIWWKIYETCHACWCTYELMYMGTKCGPDPYRIHKLKCGSGDLHILRIPTPPHPPKYIWFCSVIWSSSYNQSLADPCFFKLMCVHASSEICDSQGCFQMAHSANSHS